MQDAWGDLGSEVREIMLREIARRETQLPGLDWAGADISRCVRLWMQNSKQQTHGVAVKPTPWVYFLYNYLVLNDMPTSLKMPVSV